MDYYLNIIKVTVKRPKIINEQDLSHYTSISRRLFLMMTGTLGFVVFISPLPLRGLHHHLLLNREQCKKLHLHIFPLSELIMLPG
jgi:hypothetical protein